MNKQKLIQNFPINLFASVMGFAGVTIAITHFEKLLNLAPITSFIFLIITSLLFVLNGVILVIRLIKYPEAVKTDFAHPVKMNFFATISIGLLLIAVIYLPYSNGLAFILWLTGTILQLSLTLLILSDVIWKHQFTIDQFNAAWLIPIVGNIIVPIAGVEFMPHSINWIFFSIGILFSIIYFTLFFNRSFFHSKVPQGMFPTYFILMAPPAIGFTSYLKLVDRLDGLAFVLYGTAIFIGLLLSVNIKRFVTVPFSVAWWAYLFPSAAMTGATFQIYQLTNERYFIILFYAQLFFLICLALYNLTKTFVLYQKEKLL